MPSVPIIFKPGIDTQSTAALNAASWNESENIRFFQGLAQKNGGFMGYTQQVAGGGRPSALRAWTGLAGISYLATGSQERISLEASANGYDITPLTKLSLIPISLSTTAGSQTVTVLDPLNQPLEGDWLVFRAPITIGGIVLDGVYRVDSVVDPTHYTILSAVAAVSTVSNGGTARQFTTAGLSTTVTVDFDDHGLFSGEVVYISEPVTVGGITLFGNYIATVPGSDTYTITAASAATGNDTTFEHGGNLALAFLSGLIRAASATVEPFDADASHINLAIGVTVEPYVSGGVLTYAAGDSLRVVGGTGAIGTVPIIDVATTQVVTVTINNVGSGGTPGVHTFRGSDGTGTAFEFTATVAADGTLTGAIPAISVPGSYTVNPSLTNQALNDLTDGTTLDATVDVGMWPLGFTITDPGAMIVFPANPVANQNTGTGRGATLNIAWDFGYAIADILTLVGGTGGEEPTFLLLTLSVARVIIRNVGTGGSLGTHTFRGTTGTGTRFEFTAQVAADGTLTGADPVITVPGTYTVAPTSLMGEPITDITDATLTGATVDISMWPATVSLYTAGSLTTVPDNPVATSDSGTGSGAELDVTWDYSAGSQNDLSVEYVILDNWGEYLVAIPARRPVYVWRPQDGVTVDAQNVGTAPQSNISGFVATQQQILVVTGTINFGDDLFDPMLVRWSDAGDYTNFIPASANQAGSFRLQLGSTIITGLAIASRNLIWTDLGVYAMQYQGLPFVFSFQPIGVNCGLVGPHAVGTLGDTTMWMSQNQFYVISGGGAPQMVPCSIWDQVFPNLDKASLHLVTCATNAYYGEITFYVPQVGGTVTAARIQVQSGSWDYTTIEAGSALDRAAWIDQNVFGPPMGADPAGNIYRQETTSDADGEVLATRLLSGLAMIAEGDLQYQLSHIYPDMKFGPDGRGAGTVWMKVFLYKDMQAPPRVKGPYPINAKTRRIPCRGRGKGIQFEFSSTDLASDWRIGRVEYEAIPDGRGG